MLIYFYDTAKNSKEVSPIISFFPKAWQEIVLSVLTMGKLLLRHLPLSFTDCFTTAECFTVEPLSGE